MTMKSSFNEDECNVFLSTNITFTKLNIQIFRDFLHKHTKQIIPNEPTLRKTISINARQKLLLKLEITSETKMYGCQ